MPPPVHELAICQALMTQVRHVAEKHGAQEVGQIVLKVGALSGVEPFLLKRAFEVARAGTVADAAELVIQSGPIEVKCRTCGAESEVVANRLLCANCGDWQVNVTAGEELLLLSLELVSSSPDSKPPAVAGNEARSWQTRLGRRRKTH